MKHKRMAIFWVPVLLLVSVLAGCSGLAQEPVAPALFYGDCQSVEWVGQVPAALEQAVDQNAFHGVTAFEDRLLKANILAVDEQARTITHQIQMMDIYGRELASHTVVWDYAYRPDTLTATDDGGFLFVLGFTDYSYGENVWASDKGFASRIIKCDRDANVQFDVPLEGIDAEALEFCFERNGKFYFFGDIETPETKIRGVYSRSDIYMTVLDQDGTVLKSACIAGADFDYLYYAEPITDGFLLSIMSFSDDGDFLGSNSGGYGVDWVFTVDDELVITGRSMETGRDLLDIRIGETDGEPIYVSPVYDSREPVDPISNIDIIYGVGRPTAFIDYGDYYLIVSENNTGIYPHTPPKISSIWFYTETVYSGYDRSGRLIFRAAADSSPDYDSFVWSMFIENLARILKDHLQ